MTFFISSKFSVRSSINLRSSSPSERMIFIIPFANATFVPGVSFRCTSAACARSISRGSTTISLVPLCTARRICIPSTGCACSGFEPTKRIRSDFCVISSMVFVMAPEPSVVASPATVGAWQTRAQLSVLLVWNAVLTIF